MSKTQLPSLGELRRARDRFASMLTQKTVEPDWQRLFEACPFILSTALPLKLSPLDIIPAGRPGQSEADFMIQSQFGPSEGLYGVIELKKPSTRILTARPPRQGLLQLSSQIATGVTQAHLYVAALESRVDLLDSFFMGNRRHLFLIAGMSDELVTQVTSDLLPLMQQQLRGCDLWTFDRLLKAFESQIALPTFYLLQPLLQQMMIRKKDGSRERFDRMKVIQGMLRACEKRPVSVAGLEAIADRVEAMLQERPEEMPTEEVGAFVLEELKQLDKVAYVRFASVFRHFRDIGEFMTELRDLLNPKE